MFDWHNRTLIASAAAVLISGFCVGFLTARATGGHGGTSTVAASDIQGPSSGLFGRPRSANAPRAGDVKPSGFAVWKQRLDTSGNSPKACITFSHPLDPSKPYGDYVVVTPALPSAPAVSAKDSELCVAGLGFTDRRITVLKGLPGQGGDTLKANADLDFTFGTKPPYVGFAGSGVILPRTEADGVAIETINVSKLGVEVWRVSDRNLVRKTVSAPEPVAEGDYSDDYGDDSANDIGVKIWTGKIGVKIGNGERVTTVFPLGSVLKTLQPGAYVVKVRDSSGNRDKGTTDDQPAQARRWIIYTDMAMTTYKGANGLDVVVRSLKTARPLGGVKIDLVASNGDTLGEARSSLDGHVAFNGALLKGTDALQPKMVMAYAGDDYTATDLTRSPMDLTAHGTGGRQDGETADGRANSPGVDSYVYTDRGIYRPGETVHLVAMVRDPQGRVIKDRKGFLIISRPSGVEAFRFGFTKTPMGYAGADVILPKTAPRGQWKATVKLDGMDDAAGSAAFAVEDFAPQRLGVDVKANAQQPLLSLTEQRPVQVSAHYLYGAIGSGLQV
ncbi:MAG: MG2 domain-containing protein, partial [Asticcacaulis sp.]